MGKHSAAIEPALAGIICNGRGIYHGKKSAWILRFAQDDNMYLWVLRFAKDDDDDDNVYLGCEFAGRAAVFAWHS